MKRYLLILLLGIISFIGKSQGEQIYYKIIFDSYVAFTYPCDDGDGGYNYYPKSEISNVKFTVNGETVIEGSIKDITDPSITVTAVGSGLAPRSRGFAIRAL